LDRFIARSTGKVVFICRLVAIVVVDDDDDDGLDSET
jgi:hypothetical protein